MNTPKYSINSFIFDLSRQKNEQYLTDGMFARGNPFKQSVLPVWSKIEPRCT
ncbi:hypothetical protein L489_4845 [Bordetella bronchiseptica 00-P-2730]|nr:hypothetical protein L489_5741 [Bordetella bronchiseptica 00-P-2730]KCV33548.1 hypothetical protein L489_4845 [Bordetella bronchiseptica 00-P-2730]